MPDSAARRLEFSAAYAGFLLAAHQSFRTATVRLPTLSQRIRYRSARKPWKPVLDAALDLSAQPDGLILEFGVFRGDSIRHMAMRRPGTALHGFDSFQGFPDDQRTDWRQDFAVERLPDVPSNVTLHAGFFEDTLPDFIANWRGARPEIALIHIDCDIFSSTRTIFNALGSYLRAGDVVVFDELMNYTEFATNEFLALYLMLNERGLDFEWAVTWGRPYPLGERAGVMLDRDFIGYRRAGYVQNQAIRLRERAAHGHFDLAAPDALVRRIHDDLAVFFASSAWDSGVWDRA